MDIKVRGMGRVSRTDCSVNLSRFKIKFSLIIRDLICFKSLV